MKNKVLGVQFIVLAKLHKIMFTIMLTVIVKYSLY